MRRLIFVLLLFFLCVTAEERCEAITTTHTTEYKSGGNITLGDNASFSGTTGNALAVQDNTHVFGNGTHIQATGTRALLYISRGGTVELNNAVLTGIGLKDSAVALFHKLGVSETPGASALILRNGSVQLNVDPADDQALFNISSTNMACPVTLTLDGTRVEADHLAGYNQLFSVATYATLIGTGAADRRTSIVVGRAAANSTVLQVDGATVALNETDITVNAGDGDGLFLQTLDNYPSTGDPVAHTAPDVSFRNGTISVDGGMALVGLATQGSLVLENAGLRSNGYGLYLQGGSAPGAFSFRADGLNVTVSASAEAALMLNKVATVTASDPNASFVFTGSVLESAGPRTVWLYDNNYADRIKNLDFIRSSIVNSAGGRAFLVNGGRAAQTLVRLTDSRIVGVIETNKDAGSSTVFRLDNSVFEGAYARSVQGVDRLDFQLVNGSSARAYLDGVSNLSVDASSLWTLQLSEADGLLTPSVRDNLALEGGLAFGPDRLPSQGRAVRALPSAFGVLGTGALSGGGTLYMRADIESDTADRLDVTGDATGAHRLYVTNSGAEPSRRRMTSYLVTQGGGDGSFSLANPGGLVDAGTYAYALGSETLGAGLGWYLYRTDKLTPPARVAQALADAGGVYAVWHGQLGNLRERMGELRSGTAANGLWTRGLAEERHIEGVPGNGYRQRLAGGALGWDRRVDAGRSQWFLGVRGQWTRGTQKFDHVDGARGAGVTVGGAAYATWLRTDGWYADAVLALDRHSQSVRVPLAQGGDDSGRYRVWGWGASLETGRQFALGRGLFVEPQAELSLYRVSGVSYGMDNGLRVRGDGVNSLNGRVGAVAGKNWRLTGDRLAQVYAKGGINHEFLSSQHITLNTDRFSANLRGTRVYYGVGAAANLTRKLSLYGEVEREHGSRMDKKWGVTAGLRCSF